ncbi:hypothetical protein ACHAXR_011073 [Thalassiosira sp. AJA248-18]
MIRRLIQTPAYRPGRRKSLMKRNTPSPYTSLFGSRRYDSGDAVRSQLDGDAPSLAHFATSPGSSSLPHSRGFEIQGISTRELSSDAIQATNGGGLHHFFGTSALSSEDTMLSPFLNVVETRERVPAEDPVAFMELFKAISTLNPTPESTDISTLDVGEKGEGETHDEEVKLEGETHNEEVKLDDVTGTATVVVDDKVEELQSKNIEEEKHRISCELGQVLRSKSNSHDLVMDVFDKHRELLDEEQLINVFYFISKKDLRSGYTVLKYLEARCKEQGRLASLDLYLKIVHGIRSVELDYRVNHQKYNTKGDRRFMSPSELQTLVEDVTEHIQEEFSEGKKMVYQYILLPALVVNLSEHQDTTIKCCAKPIMEYILDSQFPILSPEIYDHMLGRTTHGRTGPDYIPHHRVLSWLVSNGYTPKRENVINVLQCYHPFRDLEATHDILTSILKLQSENDSPSDAEDYRIDLGTLEAISMASARKNIELNLLVWDLVEQSGYNPTESMFEDVVMSFAATRQDNHMYAALVDMEKNGFAPSPALLRYVALQIANLKWTHQKRLDHSYKVLTWHENEHMRSTHTMNILIVGYGMRRDINSAFLVFEDCARFNIAPDASTFTFLMEALYIDTKDRFPHLVSKAKPQYNPEDRDDVVGAAQVILDAMAEAGVPKSKHFVHEHVRLLCVLGLVEEANLVLDEAITTGAPVHPGTLFVLATKLADTGDFEMAYAVAGTSVAAGCGKLPNLVSRINNIRNPRQRTERRHGPSHGSPSHGSPSHGPPSHGPPSHGSSFKL